MKTFIVIGALAMALGVILGGVEPHLEPGRRGREDEGESQGAAELHDLLPLGPGKHGKPPVLRGNQRKRVRLILRELRRGKVPRAA